MSNPQRTNLGTLLAVGLGGPVVGQQGDHTFTLTVTGAGAVSATVAIMGSNDLVGWVQIASVSASGTGVGSGAASVTSSYAYWRADAAALAAGAVASVMAATEEGQGQGVGSSVAADRKARALRLLKRADASNLFINPVPANPATVAMTATDPALAVNYNMVGLIGASSDLWRVYGGIEKNDGGNYAIVAASGGAAGAGNGTPKQSVTNAPAIEFITASPTASLKFFGNGAAQKMRVAVNGAYHSGILAAPGTGVNYLTIGVGATSLPAGANRIRIEAEQSSGNNRPLFQNIYVASSYSIYAPAVDETIDALFVGDSYFSTGAAGQFEHDGLPAIVGKRLGWDYWPAAIGGTGYVNAGANSVYGSPGRLADYALKSFDYVVVLGSVNDTVGAVGSAAYNNTYAAALALYQQLRIAQPTARIFVFGVPATVNQPLANALQNEAALMDAFAAWGDGNAVFVPISTYGTAGSLAWITAAGTANFIAADSVHLNQTGVYYIADRMVQAIRRAL